MANDSEFNKLIREMHTMMGVLDERSRSILQQAEKTNGRVTKLEDNVDSLSKVQEGLVVKVGAFVTILATAFTTAIAHILK